MASPNGTGYFLPAERAQGLANYPHARTAPQTSRIIFVSGTSSRRGDGTYEGCETLPDGTHKLDCGAQTAAVLKNIESIIRGVTGGRCGLESVVDATVFLTDMRDYAANERRVEPVLAGEDGGAGPDMCPGCSAAK